MSSGSPSSNTQPTLIRPPPDDPNKSPIENVLDVLELGVIGPVSLNSVKGDFHLAHDDDHTVQSHDLN